MLLLDTRLTQETTNARLAVGTVQKHCGNPFVVETAHRIERYPAGQRTVGLTESTDFETWSRSVQVLSRDRMNQTYSMQIFAYGGIYLGLVMIIHLGSDRVDCELTWSPDAMNWQFVDPGNPIIPTGSSEGDYDWGCVYAATAPIATEGGIRVYYGSSNGRHWSWRDGYLCLAMLRKDGWAGYEPVDPNQVGTIVTTPVDCGAKLSLTADAAGGSVQVTILDEAGKALATSDPIQGNATDREVKFAKSDQLPRLAGHPLRLKFGLQRAKLFSFSFGD